MCYVQPYYIRLPLRLPLSGAVWLIAVAFPFCAHLLTASSTVCHVVTPRTDADSHGTAFQHSAHIYGCQVQSPNAEDTIWCYADNIINSILGAFTTSFEVCCRAVHIPDTCALPAVGVHA